MSMDALADVAWALAASHHDSAALPQMEAALLALGGFKAMRPLHAATILWCDEMDLDHRCLEKVLKRHSVS